MFRHARAATTTAQALLACLTLGWGAAVIAAEFTVRGATYLDAAEIDQALQGTTSVQQAAAALRQAYSRAGYASVQVRVVGTTLEVYEGRFTAYEGPARYRPYFSGVLDQEPLRTSDVVTASTRAQQRAGREGVVLNVSSGPGANEREQTLVANPVKRPGWRPVRGNFTLGNYGNRFAGRDIGGVGLNLNPGAGTQVDLQLSKGVNRISQHNEGADYQSAELNLSLASRWGTYGLRGQVVDFQSGEDSVLIVPRGTDGDIRRYAVWGEQIAYADPGKALSFSQSVENVHYRIDVDSDTRLFEQDYTFANLGTRFQFDAPVLPRARIATSAWIKQGISGDFDGIRVPTAGPGPDPDDGAIRVGGGSGIINIGDLIFVSGGTGTIVIRPGNDADAPDDPDVVLDPRGASTGAISRPDEHFSVGGLGLSFTQQLTRRLALGLTAQGQYTDDTLPNLEQFVLGGFGNLTAWLPGVAEGDRGYLTRAGLTFSDIRAAGLTFGIGGFVEAGGAEFADPVAGAGEWRSLSDGGVSLTAQTGFGTTLTFGYAQGIGSDNVDSEERSRARADLFFYLVQNW